MPLITTDTFEITLPKHQIKELLYSFQEARVRFEILNPHELGENWNHVIPVEHDVFFSKKKELEILSEAIDLTAKKSFFSSFADSKIKASLTDLTNIIELEKEITAQAESIIQGNLVGVTDDLRKKLQLLHAALELESATQSITSKFFHVNSNSDRAFAFIVVPKPDSGKISALFSSHQIPSNIVDWPSDITIWSNPSGLSAFQSILQSLGSITKKELDPTFAVAILYMLFFAFCMADAFYGIIISGFTGYFLYFTKLKPELKNTFNLFFFSGLATIVFGALLNSWAGNLFYATPANNVLGLFHLIDPLDAESPAPINVFLHDNGGYSPIVFLLGLSIVIGFFTVLAGYTFNTINSFRKGHVQEGLSDISWIFLIVSIVLAIALPLVNPSLGTIGIILLAIGFLLQFIFNSGLGIPGKIFSGLIRIYELISVFADTLSFTRLVAVGLTGSIIANVINLLAILIYESTGPIIGFILAAVILIIGHLFNLVVALFGAYINPLRLSYVEFLPKFFKGSGRSLTPDTAELKYLTLTSS